MRYVIIALLLAGCGFTTKHAHENCTGYGFVQGTPAMAECMQREFIAHKNRAAIGQGNSIRAYDAIMKNFK